MNIEEAMERIEAMIEYKALFPDNEEFIKDGQALERALVALELLGT